MKGSPAKILIADDEESMRRALADFFSSDERFEVIPTASDADRAIALAGEYQPAVALLDVRMPGGGGPAAARGIRECSPGTRIVALSAHEDRETVLRMLESGATGYVVKGDHPASIMDAALKAVDGLATLSPEVVGGVIDVVAAQLHIAREDEAVQKMRRHREGELRLALSRSEFELAYQPKVSLMTGRMVGVETLLRWRHPTRGLVPPLDFIPLAEESGLIVPIGSWVLEKACNQAREWAHALPGNLPVSMAVNVSPRQFEDGLAEMFGQIIARSGVDPSSLCLELTEGTVMDEPELAITTLRQLKLLGVSISIDDFGTGFSSLAYLKRFPLDELKVDKSFVDGLGHDSEDTAIVATVMGMAHALDLRVVAEGVETADQASRLRILGCDEGQGFYYARPGTAADIFALLEAAGELPLSRPGERVTGRTANTFSERILVVDDAADVRQLARSSLVAAGFEVEVASSGEDAIIAASEFKPDCVVLDLNLPGISGLEVCRLIRLDPEQQHTTIVMLTVDRQALAKVEAFSLDADDYIVKPFTPRDLVSRVTASMRRRGLPAPAAAELAINLEVPA